MGPGSLLTVRTYLESEHSRPGELVTETPEIQGVYGGHPKAKGTQYLVLSSKEPRDRGQKDTGTQGQRVTQGAVSHLPRSRLPFFSLPRAAPSATATEVTIRNGALVMTLRRTPATRDTQHVTPQAVLSLRPSQPTSSFLHASRLPMMVSQTSRHMSTLHLRSSLLWPPRVSSLKSERRLRNVADCLGFQSQTPPPSSPSLVHPLIHKHLVIPLPHPRSAIRLDHRW